MKRPSHRGSADGVPTSPVPTSPVPTSPVPTRPVPTRPVPTRPVPTSPVPTSPVPTRPAAVAGRFYPGQPGALADLVDTLLDAAPVPAGDELASAYLVPHAGYPYSGPTAALVYARLRRHADRIRRVILLGPAHQVPLSGCATPATERWATPLGEARIDSATVRRLAGSGHAAIDDRPHAPEHSLEVQLPFLQRALPAAVPLVPILVGESRVDQVAATLAAILAEQPPTPTEPATADATEPATADATEPAAGVEPATVVLCSTDLSHYLDLATAEARDARTARAVLDLSADQIGTGDACGLFALRGLLGWARATGLGASLLHRCTSADATGDTSRVVGYAAFAFADRPGETRAPGLPR